MRAPPASAVRRCSWSPSRRPGDRGHPAGIGPQRSRSGGARQAVFWLSQVGTDRAVGALDSILRISKDPEIQEKAVFALSQHESPRASRRCAPTPSGPRYRRTLREKAIFWMGSTARRRTRRSCARSTAGSRAGAQEKMLFSLSQMGGAGERLAARHRRDTRRSIEMRKQALFWAGQGGVPIGELTAVRQGQRPGDAGAADLRLLPAGRAGGAGQADRHRQARPRPGAPEAGALLAGPVGDSPRSAGAPGHHRTAIGTPSNAPTRAVAAARCCCSPGRSPRRSRSGSARSRNGTVRLSFAARRASAATGITTSPSARQRRVGEGLRAPAGAGRAPVPDTGYAVRTYVGGRWLPDRWRTDLGTVRPQEAADYFSSWPSGRPSPPAIRSSPRPWRTASRSGPLLGWPERPVPLETAPERRVLAGPGGGSGGGPALDSVADDTGDREVRKQAVFALSQRRRRGRSRPSSGSPAPTRTRSSGSGPVLAGPERGSAGARSFRGDSAVRQPFPRLLPSKPRAIRVTGLLDGGACRSHDRIALVSGHVRLCRTASAIP